jgi:hypothetical protein
MVVAHSPWLLLIVLVPFSVGGLVQPLLKLRMATTIALTLARAAGAVGLALVMIPFDPNRCVLP